MEKEKPPIIVSEGHLSFCDVQAQRDADVAWYEAKIEQIIKDDATRCAEYLESARQEIFEEFEKNFTIYILPGSPLYDVTKSPKESWENFKSRFLKPKG